MFEPVSQVKSYLAIPITVTLDYEFHWAVGEDLNLHRDQSVCRYPLFVEGPLLADCVEKLSC